jgi:uncharacterized membrane protein HdeD (DUF308 family)
MATAKEFEYNDSSYYLWSGAFSILAGILVLVWPKLTLATLVFLISVWLLISGVFSLVESIRSIKKGGWAWLALGGLGLLQLGVGAYLVQRPGVTALTVVTLLGLLFVMQGFVFVARTFLTPNIDGGQRALSMVFAILSLVAGVWVWRYPLQSGLAFVWLVGLYAIISGTLQIAAASQADK